MKTVFALALVAALCASMPLASANRDLVCQNSPEVCTPVQNIVDPLIEDHKDDVRQAYDDVWCALRQLNLAGYC